MMSVAQTNLQLYNQLLRIGHGDTTLRELRETYDLAREVFAALFRPSGKTFIAHLIGTASIVAECGEDPDVIKAAMMHAAYLGGDFGDRKSGMTEEKRTQVRGIIGARAEQIVYQYAQFPWPPVSTGDLQSMAASTDHAVRSAALVRVANELEEHIDLGSCYCSERVRKRLSLDETTQNMLIRSAEALGRPDLCAALREAFASTASARIPEVLRSRQSSERSVLIPPRTYQRVMQMVVARMDK